VNCPRDGSRLQSRALAGVSIHVCGACSGLLLDRGELNKIAEPTGGDLEFSTLDLDSQKHEDEFSPAPCPRCGAASTMEKVEFNIHTGIILDHCRRCGAFWLDGEELERINGEVRELNEAAREVEDPPMLWFARFVWGLPR